MDALTVVLSLVPVDLQELQEFQKWVISLQPDH